MSDELHHWNYRVVVCDSPEGHTWGLYEVWYARDGRPVARTADPISFISEEGLADLLADLRRAAEDAATRPVLFDSAIGDGSHATMEARDKEVPE